jgi:hypothetical protein
MPVEQGDARSKQRAPGLGQRSERSARLIEQLGARELDELEASAVEDELAAEKAVGLTSVRAFTRRRAERDGLSRGHDLVKATLGKRHSLYS